MFVNIGEFIKLPYWKQTPPLFTNGVLFFVFLGFFIIIYLFLSYTFFLTVQHGDQANLDRYLLRLFSPHPVSPLTG